MSDQEIVMGVLRCVSFNKIVTEVQVTLPEKMQTMLHEWRNNTLLFIYCGTYCGKRSRENGVFEEQPDSYRLALNIYNTKSRFKVVQVTDCGSCVNVTIKEVGSIWS